MFSVAELLSPEFRAFERRVRRAGHDCGKCGLRHYDARFRWCLDCRVLQQEYGKAYRRDHKLRGLCMVCSRRHDHSSRCTGHRESHNEWARKNYEAKRAAGLCGKNGCQVETDSSLCPMHAEMNAKWQRDFVSRKRARWS